MAQRPNPLNVHSSLRKYCESRTKIGVLEAKEDVPVTDSTQSSIVYVNAAGEAWVEDAVDVPSVDDYLKFKRDVDACLERLKEMDFDGSQATSPAAAASKGGKFDWLWSLLGGLLSIAIVPAAWLVGLFVAVPLVFSGWWALLGIPLLLVCFAVVNVFMDLLGGVLGDGDEGDTHKFDGVAAGYTAYYNCDGGGCG